MSKSATEVMQEAIFASVLDAIEALRKASKGLPNNMLRDLNALHVNTSFADTPAELQAAVQASVRTALSRLQREGYAIADAKSVRTPPRTPPRDNAGGSGRPPLPRGRGPRPDGPGGRPPRPRG